MQRSLQRLWRPRASAPIVLLLAGARALYPQTAAHPDTSWERGAVCYEIFVRSFLDSDGDGIGDLRGLTRKLDYVNDGNPATSSDLGARCVWLMPVATSPSYHGYDVSDYYTVNPQYGTNQDFRDFVAAAHARGIRVLVDMVLNHASSEHPYFQEALRDTASPYRGWFRWSPTKPAQRGPWGQEVWHHSPVRDEYYYGIFWSGMPDLNYENPAVRSEAKRVARFWLQEMGVDGFRLDAIPYLVEDGERVSGTEGTHAFLREYASYIREIAPAAYTVGEVWDSVGAMLPYYPDQLTSHFAFELSDAIIRAERTGSSRQLFDGYLRLQRSQPPERWSPFLRNHDQTRTMTVLAGDVARAKQAATLLLTLPGLPFVYYGEEIGMTGDKPDEQLRTPMQWRAGAGVGFTTGTPWEAPQADAVAVNVAAEDADSTSLLNLYRQLIHLRTEHSALASGTLLPLAATTDAAAAWLRRADDETVLVVANLGSDSMSSPRFSSADSVLAPGRYALIPILGSASRTTMQVEPGGLIRGVVPVARLRPHESYVFEVRRMP